MSIRFEDEFAGPESLRAAWQAEKYSILHGREAAARILGRQLAEGPADMVPWCRNHSGGAGYPAESGTCAYCGAQAGEPAPIGRGMRYSAVNQMAADRVGAHTRRAVHLG